MEKIESYAKKTFLALKDPYHTVVSVRPGIIDRVSSFLEKQGTVWYTGIKNTDAIPAELKERLEKSGFLIHTTDKMALGGRAVDLQLVNPITGNWMTGSSSGTALNVFYGINDAGIGTDGGGSVLAPAAALNLYGFISPMIEQEKMNQYHRISTDGIGFQPAIGAITRDLETMEKLLSPMFGYDLSEFKLQENNYRIIEVQQFDNLPDIYGSRELLIKYLKNTVKSGTVVISTEGPVDVNAPGDSIRGHFDEDTARCQARSGKGLMRVVNMSGKSALTVPAKGLGRCIVLICESRQEDIAYMFRKARLFQTEPSALIQRYFMNFDMYFQS
nr:amidase family protein [uncultured Clostridium sp.]